MSAATFSQSRRLVLIRCGAIVAGAVAGIPLESLVEEYAPAAAPEKRSVSFNDAVQNPDLRQQYIDQLVEREPSPYVEKVIYDHDKSLAKKAAALEIDELKNAEFWGVILLRYIDELANIDSTLANLGGEGKKAFIEGLLGSPEFDNIIQTSSKMLIDSIEITPIITLHPLLEIGNNTKSKVYLFDGMFNDYKIKDTTFNPSEELIRTAINHEYAHAEDNYLGIELEDLIIGNSNYWKIHPKVFQFLRETRAHAKSIKFAEQFGMESQPYLFAIMALEIYLSSSGILEPQPFNILPVENFAEFDRKIVQYQTEHIRSLFPEIVRIREKLGIER